MSTADTWYPPSLGTGDFLANSLLLSNSPFAAMPDHCILDFQSQPPRMVCLHCGSREVLPLPLPISEAERRGDDWIRQQRRCPRPGRGQGP